MPWWAKIAAKIVLSRLPIAYRVFARLGMFRHGHMESAKYALGVYHAHLKHTGSSQLKDNAVVLELGPGDSLGSALIAQAFGASRCYLIDAGRFAETDMAAYQQFAQELRQAQVPCMDLTGCNDVDTMLTRSGGVYLTAGLASLREIPDNSVDFIWSQAVLEHLRVHEFVETHRQLKRILRADGVVSHRVDLKDHLGGSLNNMRIASRIWEQEWMARSGFYTNRLRYSQMLSSFADAGFAVQVIKVDRWSEPPLPRHKLAPEFRCMDTDDLVISGFTVVLRQPDERIESPP